MENEKQQPAKEGQEHTDSGSLQKEGEVISEIKNAHASGMGSLGKSEEQLGEPLRKEEGETRKD